MTSLEEIEIESQLQTLSTNMELEQDLDQLNKITMLYQFWPGKNEFFRNGKFIGGPKEPNRNFRFTISLITLISLFHFSILSPFIQDYFYGSLNICTLIFFLATWAFFFLCSFTDPGIIPRRQIFELTGKVPDCFEELPKSNNCINELVKKQRKYCETCDIYRPIRSHHCKYCDNCVEVYDHHCSYLNNCIGKRNYRFFIGLLISLIGLGGSILTSLMIYIYAEINYTDSSMIQYDRQLFIFIIIFLWIILAIFILIIIFFLSYHIYISMKGKTTKENIKNIDISLYVKNDRKTNVDWCIYQEMLFDPQQKIQIKNFKIKQKDIKLKELNIQNQKDQINKQDKKQNNDNSTITNNKGSIINKQ